MAIYEMTDDRLRALEETSFNLVGVRERSDLQRLIRDHVEIIAPDILVIAEEFGDWEDSRRRIDLLALDKDANLVVIELKRTEDGGHMELQAIRYAGMVSAMTFERIVDVHARFLRKLGRTEDAEAAILEFLGWDEPEEDAFAQDVRIIPLPEAEDFIVGLREKDRRERKERAERYGIRRRFWTALLDRARSRTALHANISPSENNWISTGVGIRGLALNYVVKQHEAVAELYIDRGASCEAENKAVFDRLHRNREQIEAEFGGPLDWQRLDGKQACRIKETMTAGGYRSGEQQWPEIHEAMIDAMIRLHKALEPYIDRLKTEPIESDVHTAALQSSKVMKQ